MAWQITRAPAEVSRKSSANSSAMTRIYLTAVQSRELRQVAPEGPIQILYIVQERACLFFIRPLSQFPQPSLWFVADLSTVLLGLASNPALVVQCQIRQCSSRVSFYPLFPRILITNCPKCKVEKQVCNACRA